ncbi:MAG TPA: FAD-dependent oxidoreductase [Gammaproteobacteria bacterium]|nr:methylamine [Gammaproteobacteria bacterium]MBQ08330.1 methylamine [Gammaproteobacteria bacterium]HJL79626.1 FAD-dependent oxidoreductase [Gammaproteobacteria bacterium]HJM08850.1 FAD-dependent oxidoreductase [Gammaproteobacteria bacterium]HJN01020.1 FAD-dependent oxidoreductase [Gammaproteobacteria bacterium]
MNKRYKILFEPVDIGPVTAKNRFYQVPHAMGAGNDMPQTRAAQRGIKAEGGWGVINTGYCSIHPSSDDRPLPFARIWTDEDIPAHEIMVKAVHEHDALAGIELFHGGAYTPNRHSRLTSFSPSGVQPRPPELDTMSIASPKVMDNQDIKNLIQWHIDATKRSLKAGFDIIYCYAGMGFLPYHFLHPDFNKRTDGYGGSLENRARLITEIISAMKETAEGKAAIAVRISTDELLKFKSEHAESEAHELFEMIGELPDLWDLKLSQWTKECPAGRFAESGHMRPYNSFAKALTTKPVVGVGWFTSPDIMVKQINDGVLDFVGAARASIADPFLPNKLKEGREDDIRECIGCNICASCYNGGIPVRCTQNPTMGEEWRRGWHPEKHKAKTSDSRILIIGGGPAGLEAATTLSKRGYQITIAEKKEQLGGRINNESILPGMSSYQRVIDYRLGQINQSDRVETFLSNELKKQDVLDLGFDHVVTATGSKWNLSLLNEKLTPFNIGKMSNVVTPDDIFKGAEIQDEILIYDFDFYYMGGLLAEYLTNQGKNVSIISPFPNISPWSFMSNELNEIALRLHEKNIETSKEEIIQNIETGHVITKNLVSDEMRETNFETLIIVGNRIPHRELYDELMSEDTLGDHGIKSVNNIGDSNAPGAVVHAIYSGHLYANTFDDDSHVNDLKFEYTSIQ